MFRLWILPFLFPVLLFAQKKEAWVHRPLVEWPTIALTNHVEYQNGDRYIDPSFDYAGTGFLVDVNGTLLAATVKHVLWIARNKATDAVEVNADLKHWVMRKKGSLTDSVVLGELINEDANEVLEGPNSKIQETDWLLFTVLEASPNITPLKARVDPVPLGEKVYLSACPYEWANCTTHSGRLIRKEGNDLLIDLGEQEVKGGMSGGAVMDSNGHLIGIASSVRTDSATGRGFLVAVSLDYPQEVLKGKLGNWDELSPRKENTVVQKGGKEYRTEGVWLSADGGARWAQISKGLPADAKPSYLSNLGRDIVLGTENAGVFLLDDGRNYEWKSIGAGLPGLKINALYVSKEKLYVGVYQKGLFVSSDRGKHWESLNQNLEDLRVQSILQIGEKLMVGTDSGIFAWNEEEQSWEGKSEFMQVNHLKYSEGRIFAGTSKGLLLSTDQGNSWEWVLQQTAVQSMILTSERVVTMSYSGEVYTSGDWGKTWEPGVYEFHLHSEIYAATSYYAEMLMCNNYGILVSKDGGLNWKPLVRTSESVFIDFLKVGDMLWGSRIENKSDWAWKQ